MPIKLVNGHTPLKERYRMFVINQHNISPGGISRNGLVVEYKLDNSLVDTGPNGYDLAGSPAGYVNNRKASANSAINLTESYVYGDDYIFGGANIDNITVSFWLYKITTKIETANLFSIAAFAQSVAMFRVNWGNSVFILRWNDQTNNDTSENWSYTQSLNTWYHLCFVCNKSDKKIYGYLNGSLLFTSTNEFNGCKWYSGGDLLQLGRNSSSSPAYLSGGYIDDFRIYERVLTTDEITALYNE